MEYKRLSISYNSENSYLSVKRYSTASKLYLSILDDSSTFIYPENSSVVITINGYDIEIDATITSPYGDFYFSLSDNDFMTIQDNKVNFDISLKSNGNVVYVITGGVLEINDSVYFREVEPT